MRFINHYGLFQSLQKAGRIIQCPGRSRGGFTYLHVKTDALGNPLEIILTGGQTADISKAPELVNEAGDCNVIADKGYDSDALVALLEGNGCTVVIPPR